MASKICKLCHQERPIEEFYDQKYTKDGKISWCITCHNDYTQKYYKKYRDRILYHQVVERRVERNLYAKTYRLKNLEKITKHNEDQRQKYISDWLNYFKSKYGGIPKCQVCGRELEWKQNGRRTSQSVFFDHKNNNVPIKDTPRAWFESRPCNQENITTWGNCNFGILCDKCNFRLPTEDREKWFEQIKQYIYGGEDHAFRKFKHPTCGKT